MVVCVVGIGGTALPPPRTASPGPRTEIWFYRPTRRRLGTTEPLSEPRSSTLLEGGAPTIREATIRGYKSALASRLQAFRRPVPIFPGCSIPGPETHGIASP